MTQESASLYRCYSTILMQINRQHGPAITISPPCVSPSPSSLHPCPPPSHPPSHLPWSCSFNLSLPPTLPLPCLYALSLTSSSPLHFLLYIAPSDSSPCAPFPLSHFRTVSLLLNSAPPFTSPHFPPSRHAAVFLLPLLIVSYHIPPSFTALLPFSSPFPLLLFHFFQYLLICALLSHIFGLQCFPNLTLSL